MLRFLVLSLLVVCALGAVPKLRQRRPKMDGRIVGGEDADIKDFPFQLSYQYGGSHICGASIHSENWAVTAGHCVDDIDAADVSLRAGSSILEQGGSVHDAEKLVQHPKYDYYTLDFDVAVIQVKTPFEFGDGVQPIDLTDSEPKVGDTATISGWGTTEEGSNTLPKQLQKVNIPIVSRNSCNDAYSDYGGITDNMICAAVEQGGKDSCQGDSGGPLTVDGKLAGIVSWGVGCAEEGYPGVYSNVATLGSWITENAQ